MISLTDVALRDGLQMESVHLPTDKKYELFQKLARCGYERLEITSFASPQWIPQLGDASLLCDQIFKNLPSIETMAFVPNEKGLERFLAYPIPWVSLFVAVSETFNQKNVNKSRLQTLEELALLVMRARKEKRKVRVYVSTTFGCPYEGKVIDKELFNILTRVVQISPDEVALSDTIGVATPNQVKNVVSQFAKMFPKEKIVLHLHNTYGLAIASALTGAEWGITHFDGATGGIGGCPYAKGATGNVGSEALNYAFFRIGHTPSFSAQSIFEAVKLEKDLGLKIQSPLFDIWDRGGKLFE